MPVPLHRGGAIGVPESTTIPSGGPPLLLGDSYRPDRWRDLTLHATRLARRL